MIDESRAGGLTATSSLLGTPYYMSPEQAESSKYIDARTDQYASAVILYEALCGKRPFEGESMLALLNRIHSGTHPMINDLRPDLPPEVSSAVERAMHRDPAARFASVLDLARVLLPFASERVRVLYAKQIEGAGRVVIAPPLARAQDASSLSGAARTTDALVETQSESKAGRALLYGTSAFVVVLIGGMGWASYALMSRRPPERRVTSTVASASASQPQPAEAPSGPRGLIVHKCAKDLCDKNVAWCDGQEVKVACCAEGLVARSNDGVCGCPPGGSPKVDLQGQGCKAPSLSEADQKTAVREVIRSGQAAYRNRYNAGLDASRFEGTATVAIELTPDGEVFSARVESSSVMNEEVQRRLLKVAHTMHFAAPAGGTLTMKVPVVLKAQ
jgi:TonB family protein